MNKTPRYWGAVALVLSLSTAGFLAVKTLTAAVESPTRNATLAKGSDSATIAALEQRVAQLEAQVKALVTKTQLITSDGAQNFTLHVPQQLSLTGGTSLSLKSGGPAALEASGNVVLKGATVKVNGGSRPAARQGDLVATSGAGTSPTSATGASKELKSLIQRLVFQKVGTTSTVWPRGIVSWAEVEAEGID